MNTRPDLEMRPDVKVGMVGAGFILKSHATAVAQLPGHSLHLIADASLSRAKSAAVTYGFARAVGSIAEMAASDCDVVHILLPPALHLEAATAMVETGKSVFLEKPMGLSSGDCDALCDLAANKGVSVGVNHNFLFAAGYERLRGAIERGELGKLDQVAVDWHYALPLLQFGPFDNWMLAAPQNLAFELGPHLAAFIMDLAGLPSLDAAVAGNPMALPGGKSVFRQWNALGRVGAVNTGVSIAITAGQEERLVRVRGRGGSMRYDFGRDIGWLETTTTDNPIFDAYATAAKISKQLGMTASSDRRRRIWAALKKRPDANPFEDSIFRSIATFYRGGVSAIDSRHDGRFGVQVIKLCETIIEKAGVAADTHDRTIARPSKLVPDHKAMPTVLVIGGTGFIGKRLVRELVARGLHVRVMTRNVRAAAIELADLPVDLFEGSHGNAEAVTRALAGIDIVYHLAKCEGKRWQDYVDGDISPTRVLAEAALAAQVSRFIYTGTIDSYASARVADVIDNRTLVDARIASRNFYARSKAACEALLQDLTVTHALPLVIMRPGIVIGAGSPPAHLGVGLFASETRVDYWGKGNTPLPLVLVDDVADALARAADAPAICGKTLLLTSPPLMSARDYVEALAKHMSAQIDARPKSAWAYWCADLIKEGAKNTVRHPNRRWPTLHDWACRSHSSRYDSRMTEEALGWKPVHDRETLEARGIAEAVAWFVR